MSVGDPCLRKLTFTHSLIERETLRGKGGKCRIAIATSAANSNGYSVQVHSAPYTVFFRLDEVETCKHKYQAKNGNSIYIEMVVKNLRWWWKIAGNNSFLLQVTGYALQGAVKHHRPASICRLLPAAGWWCFVAVVPRGGQQGSGGRQLRATIPFSSMSQFIYFRESK